MPAFDKCHDQVVRAFQNAGWALLNSPFRVSEEERSIYIDMRVSRGVNGTYEQLLLIEVKCFVESSARTTDLYIAIGQYLIYRALLDGQGQSIPLYLSIPSTIYAQEFDSVVMRVVHEHRIRLVIVHLEAEQIEEWIAY